MGLYWRRRDKKQQDQEGGWPRALGGRAGGQAEAEGIEVAFRRTQVLESTDLGD